MQGFVQLPDETKVAIAALVLWLVSRGITYLVTLVPFLSFLVEFEEPLSLAIATALIGALQNAVPDAFGQVAVLAVQLVLAVLAAFGIGNSLKQRGYKFFGAKK